MAIIGPGITIGSGITFGDVAPLPEFLYTFTNFTFTTANTFGRFGPNLTSLTSWYSANSSYSGNTWVNNTSYFNQTVSGYQLWTVPSTGTYTITVAGARAGARAAGNASIYPGFGEGAVIRSSNISLTQGEKLQIVVGQEGLSYSSTGSGGGGGGTFVVKYKANLAASANSDIIMIAGGGGSINRIDANAAAYTGNTYYTANSNARLESTSGNAASKSVGGQAAGGTGGSGGSAGAYPGGGGGFLSNGAAGAQAAAFGIAYRFGANGGNANYTNVSALGGASVGGFGGGSGTHGFTGGGGAGGGYSGGGGGQQTNNWDMGGGGGSYSVDASYERVGQNRGPGYVIIVKN